MSGYANPNALISTASLEDRLNDPGLAIVEVDEDTAAFEGGHLPGATSLNWQTELHALPQRDFVTAPDLASLLAAKGISDDQTIVLYGGNNNWFAAYAYWLFRYRGIDNVKLLDGGRLKWELEDRAMTKEASATPARGTFTAGTERPQLRIFRDDVVAMATAGGTTMIDVRSPAEFSGEVIAPPHLPQEQPYVPGHIPGATNIPWSQAANDDGTFKAADELHSLYGGLGVVPGEPAVTYCRIGERAAHTWFVLTELLGYDDVRNYDGSWTEYGSLVGVPVATGP